MTILEESSGSPMIGHDEMANAIRALAMDAVEAAKSGHPGLPMGMADVATVLYSRFLKFDPSWPDWPDRDRFVLSAGHGSMLLYAVLHLAGYEDVSMDEIRRFRQLDARTAGHPEYGEAGGIETTTGPLGQGLANAVGMALAERLLAERFGSEVVDHHVYALVGDGCLMEGISHEAASLAGHLGLGKLIVLFDDNHVSIDGPTDLSVSDDQLGRFAAYGWDVRAADGHDPSAIAGAIEEAKRTDTPSLIAFRTTIGFGAPNKAGTAATHGAPLGADEVAGAREALSWPHEPFVVPDEIVASWRATGSRGQAASAGWRRRFEGTSGDRRAEFERLLAGDLPQGLDAALAEHRAALASERGAMATRKASQLTLEVINRHVPETIGGSADLTGSNNTRTATLAPISRDDFGGRYLYFGVREHAMAAVMNGMALHRGVIPYGGTFLIFSDYARPAMRLAALMGLRVIYVMTHDSIGLGEDGPTHQPVEHLAALRAIPNMNVYRPADAIETAECWELALSSARTPSVIALTRQSLPLVRAAGEGNRSALGAYELAAADGAAKVTLLATGSEVEIALAARDLLAADGIGTRVVSMPCQELFDAQDETYRRETLGPGTVRVAVEAAARFGWDRYLGADGGFVGMTGFGASAPYKDLYEHFGITAGAVAEQVRTRLG